MITVANLDDSQLLRRFVETGCQEAFNQLVNSHTNMVYSVCLRETNDPVLAQDVTQAVFLTLFHKAATIRRGTVLSGWLFNTARFAARNAMRQGNRRKAVEQELIEVMVSQSDEHIETWQTIEPLLHEAIASLGVKEREAILLRFFEDKSLKEVGAALKITEHAAQMRVLRAIEKMKCYFRKNGIPVPVAILNVLLGQHTVHGAPMSCVQAVDHLLSGLGAGSVTVASTGLAATKAHAISQGVRKSMLINKLKIASTVTALCITGAVGLVSSRPWGTLSRAVAKPPTLVDPSVPVASSLPTLPVQLVSVNVRARTVTLMEPKIIATQPLVNGAKYTVQPGDRVTVAVTPDTRLIRIERTVTAAQLQVGDAVSLLGQIRERGGPSVSISNAAGKARYVVSRDVGEYKVISLNPLRVQKANAAAGETTDEIISLSEDVQVFSRSTSIDLAEVAEVRAAGNISVETTKTPDGKLQINLITVFGAKPVKMQRDGKTTHFSIGPAF